MIDPFGPQRKYLIWSFILIIFLIVSGIAVAGEKSKWLNDNPCMIKVVTTEKCLDSQCLIKEITKEEVLNAKMVTMVLTIGSYLHNFIIQDLVYCLIAGSMQDQIILLKHQG